MAYLGELHPGSGTGIVGLWHLNSNSNDSSGNGNNGTDTGITYSRANGKFEQGAGLSNDDTTNPASSYISVPNSASLSPGSGNFSIGLWYKSSDTRTTANNFIICKYNSTTTNNVYYITEDTSNKILAFFRDGNGNSVNPTSGSAINDNKWHYIIAVRSGTSGILYIDGVAVDTKTNASIGTIDTNSAGSYLWIGTYGTGTTPGQRQQSFSGALDEIAFLNKALSASEIRKMYAVAKGRYL